MAGSLATDEHSSGPNSVAARETLHIGDHVEVMLRKVMAIHSHICSVAYPMLDSAGELPAHRNAENDLAQPAEAFSAKAHSGVP